MDQKKNSVMAQWDAIHNLDIRIVSLLLSGIAMNFFFWKVPNNVERNRAHSTQIGKMCHDILGSRRLSFSYGFLLYDWSSICCPKQAKSREFAFRFLIEMQMS